MAAQPGETHTRMRPLLMAEGMVKLFLPRKRPCESLVTEVEADDSPRSAAVFIASDSEEDHVRGGDTSAVVPTSSAIGNEHGNVVMTLKDCEDLRHASAEAEGITSTTLEPNTSHFFDQFTYHTDDVSCSSGPRQTETALKDLNKEKIAHHPEKRPGRPRVQRGIDKNKADELEDLPDADQASILQKWRSFADPSLSSGEQRFELLVAAILHAKATEVAVQKCMARLRTWAQKVNTTSQHPRQITADWLANIDPDALQEQIDGVHFHKVKSLRLRTAAVAIGVQWEGSVPARKEDLMTIPGIGPKLASILAFVFSIL